MNDTPNPDWVTWLARAECEDEISWPPPAPSVPDRGWQRLGDVAAKIVAGLIGGAMPLLAAGAVIYALRAL
jgi:hypothetical protein